MIKKEEAREKLKELVEKFYAKEKEYKSSSEADIETKLVRELFVEILGWTNDDFFQQTKVNRGDKRGRADYEFRLGDKRIFFLEVKRVGVPLDKEADGQVVSYALSKKNVSFAISTNFKQLKVFCVEEENAMNNVFRIFTEPEEYISKFEDLWLLSKESFQNNLLLKQAEKEQRLKKRVSIDKYLLEDFMFIRKIISNDIENKYSNKYSLNEKDEIVQRILDRLIFIRRCEDVGINPNELMLNDLVNGSEERAYSKLKEIFKIYDDKYNSGLFAVGEDNDCDKITISGGIIKKLIELLYQSRDKKYYYNFDWIDADVLGQVYEQYLGKILQQTKSGKAKLKEGQAHRKEQGIYYTPTYIVDYIIKNTLGETIKENRHNAKNLKILDPACGSGSFLIKAFDYLYNELKDEEKSQRNLLTTDNLGFYSLKTEILKNNLFGVDLDNRAVEITKLNLLLKGAEKNRKLPEELDLHIQKGNSLIDDETITKDYFKWQGDFQEGSFDVVIGNPPYVFTRDVEFQDSFKEYVSKNLFSGADSVSKSHARQSGKVNLYALFLIKSIKILKEGGIFGFIIPNNILRTTTYDVVRKFILDNCRIIKIVDLGAGVFEGVTASTIVLILKKEKDKQKREKNNISIFTDINNLKEKIEVEQKSFLENTSYAFNITLNKKDRLIFDSIEKNTLHLGEISIIHAGGIATGPDKTKMIENHKKNEKYKPMLEGKDIKAYYPIFANRYILYDRKLLYRARKESIFLTPEKIVTQRIGGGNRVLVVSYDDNQYYTFNSTNTILPKNSKFNLKFILAILNSKLINYYYVNKFTNKSTLTVNISKTFLEQIPIKIASETKQQNIINLVDKIILLNKQLVPFGNKQTSETKKLKDEIEKIDKEINEEVYKLYEITDEEKKIVEESLK